MKKLYRKGTVHPSPPIISDQLSFLPATILTLTVALSPEEREVLAYLMISSSANTSRKEGEHPPLFHCTCFRCYMSYWVRWDSSPNHQLIHQIIDAFEDSLLQQPTNNARNNNNNKDMMRNVKRGSNRKSRHLLKPSNSDDPQPVGESSNSNSNSNSCCAVVDEVGQDGDGVQDDDQKGPLKRFVSFIGERIWGVWGQ